MAALNFGTWVPIDLSTEVEGRERISSVIQTLARPKNMTTKQVDIPRFADADVGGGSQLTDDDSVSDTVPMYAYQYNGKATFDQAQSEDVDPDDIESFTYEWSNSLALSYDNACIGVSADRSSVDTDYQPYRSIYKAVRTNDNSGAISYTADTNYLNGSLSGSAAYGLLNSTLGKVEATTFWNDSSGVWILHPSLKSKIRTIKDPTTGALIFMESSGGFPGGGVRPQYSLFGMPAYFSHGAIVSNNFKRTVTGNPLAVCLNRQRIWYGNRIEPQVRFIDAGINTDALEHTVQCRARKGFRLTIPQTAAVLEVTG